MDGYFLGHVDEFDGLGQGILVSLGKHRITITLPGYHDFNTEVTLVPYQKYGLKTNLFVADSMQTDASIIQP